MTIKITLEIRAPALGDANPSGVLSQLGGNLPGWQPELNDKPARATYAFQDSAGAINLSGTR